MLLHTISAPVSSALAHQFRYHLHGNVDVARFQHAWQALSERHAALRTCFLWDGLKNPVQVVRRRVTVPFDYVDLSPLPLREQEQRLKVIQEADRRRGFDLRHAPLIRVTLVRLAADHVYMLWNRHHLVLDRWCVDLLFDELFQTYQGQVPSDGAQTPGVFRDYVAWIRQQNTDDGKRYWRNVLQGFKARTLLFSSPAQASQWQGQDLPSVEVAVPDSVRAALKDLAARYQMSLAAVLQGAVALLVSKWSGSQDVVFGLTVSGRPADLPRVETTMGSFISNVPVRVVLDPAMRVRDWLKSIHAAQSERFLYEYVSPVEIHRQSGLPAHEPLFDLLAVLHSPPVEVRRGPGFDIEQVVGPLDGVYPLTISLAETSGHLCVTGAYVPECVSQDTASDAVAELQRFLCEIAAKPERPLGELVPAESPKRREGDVAAGAQSYRRAQRSSSNSSTNLAGVAGTLGEIWSETLGVAPIGLDDDFFALGGSSMQAARMFSEIERRLGWALPLSTLFTAGSIRRILEVAGQPQPRTSPLVEMQPLGTRPPLFVAAGIGGHVLGLAGLARALGPDQPMYGLESRGLDGREAPATRIEELASLFVQETRSLRDGPFILLGVCWGSLVAFDMARQCSALGEPPALVILMDPTYEQNPNERGRSHGHAAAMLELGVSRLKLYWTALRAMEPTERKVWLRRKKDLLVSMISQRDPFRGDRSELIQRRVHAAHLEAQRCYRPSLYVEPVHLLLTGRRDVRQETDPRREWLKFVRADSAVSHVLGRDTGDALSRENVGVLASEIKSDIDDVIAARLEIDHD